MLNRNSRLLLSVIGTLAVSYASLFAGNTTSSEDDPVPLPVLYAAATDSAAPYGAKSSSKSEELSFNKLGVRPFVGAYFGFLGGNAELKTGITGGGEIGFAGDRFMTSISIGHYSKKNMGVSLRKGDVSLTPVMFSFYGKMPVAKEGELDKISFRAGGGFSYIFVGHNLDTPQVGATTITEDIDSGTGFHVGGGLDYWIFKNVTLSQEVLYLFYQPDVTTTFTTGTTVTRTQSVVRLDTALVLLKLKYHF